MEARERSDLEKERKRENERGCTRDAGEPGPRLQHGFIPKSYLLGPGLLPWNLHLLLLTRDAPATGKACLRKRDEKNLPEAASRLPW